MTILKEAQKIAYFATITKMRNLQLETHKNCSSDKSCSSLGAGTNTSTPSPFSVLMIQNWMLYWWSNIDADNSDFGEFQTGFNVSLGICVYINYGLYRNIYPNIYYIYILDFGEFKQDSEFLDICVSINWFPF